MIVLAEVTPLDLGGIVTGAFSGMSAYIAPVATAGVALALGFWGIPKLVGLFKKTAK